MPKARNSLLVPARAEPELDAPAAQVVDGDGRLTEHAGIAVADAEHQAADAHPRRRRRERRHRRDAFERRARRVGEVGDRVEVIPDRAPVEARVVGDPPEPLSSSMRAVLRARVDAEAHRPLSEEDLGLGVALRVDGLELARSPRRAAPGRCRCRAARPSCPSRRRARRRWRAGRSGWRARGRTRSGVPPRWMWPEHRACGPPCRCAPRSRSASQSPMPPSRDVAERVAALVRCSDHLARPSGSAPSATTTIGA